MKTTVAAIAIAMLLSGSKCQSPADKPVPSVVVVPGGPAATALNSAAAQQDDKNKAADAKKAAQLSKVVAEVIAASTAADSISAKDDEAPKKAIKDSTNQAITEAGGESVATPEDKAAAMSRVLLNLRGQYDEAKTAYAQAKSDSELAKQARDQAVKERDEAAASLKKLVDAHKAELEAKAGEAQKAMDALTAQIGKERAQHQADLDKIRSEERKTMLRYLSWGLLGFAAACFVLAVVTLYLSKGKEWERAAIAGVSGSCFSALYWTMNQPWFAYMIWGCAAVITLAVVWLIWSESKTIKTKFHLADARDTLAEKEALIRSTSAKVVSVIDKFKASLSSEQLEKLRGELKGSLDADERAVIHALRFEGETGKAAPINSEG